ncbi:hypothetical protein ES707_09389 [subsurface metagenome]
MLKYKRYAFTSIAATSERLTDILAGMAGKNRRIVSVFCNPCTNLFIRVYRDAEQFVDCRSHLCTDYAPLLPMDLPLVEGQLCKAGFYNATSSAITSAVIGIAYTED